MPSSSLAIARGLNALEMSLRRLFSSGGSMLMMVGYEANRSDRLDERAVDRR